MMIAWFAVVLLCLAMYMSLDGYDLGIGIHTLFTRREGEQREMLGLVRTAWDGNETWLILLGVALWAGFPGLYGVALPHVYGYVVIMLFAIIARGVAVEFSETSPSRFWVALFGIGSLVAALTQGAALGALALGVHVMSGAYAGTPADALGWYPALGALTVSVAYAALGTAYVRHKGEGQLRNRAAKAATGYTLAAGLLFLSLVWASSVTDSPLHVDPQTRLLALVVLGAVAALSWVAAVVWLPRGPRGAVWEWLPYAAVVTAFVACLLFVVVGRYPLVLPPDLTLQSTASPDGSLLFVLVGVGINIPLVLYYNWFAHHAFRGKAQPEPASPPGVGGAAVQAVPMPDDAGPALLRASSPWVARVAKGAVWILAGAGIYSVCIGMWGGKWLPHGMAWTWLAVIAMALFALWALVKDERAFSKSK